MTDKKSPPSKGSNQNQSNNGTAKQWEFAGWGKAVRLNNLGHDPIDIKRMDGCKCQAFRITADFNTREKLAPAQISTDRKVNQVQTIFGCFITAVRIDAECHRRTVRTGGEQKYNQ